MSAVIRLGLMVAFAVAAIGCDQAIDAGSKQSVSVKLRPPRPYKPEPGFSLATDLSVRNDESVEAQTTPRS